MGSWFAVVLRSGRLPAFLLACGCLVLLYGFLFSGDFDVDDVTVRGAQVGDPREIAATTGAFGSSIFDVDPDAIAAQLAALPYVERVTIDTEMPSRVVVNLVERTPVAVWSTDSTSFLVDQHGKVMAVGDRDDLPHVLGGDFEVTVGGTLSPERIAAVSAVHDVLGADAEIMAWSQLDGLSVRLHDKRLVIFGEAERLPLKLAVYQEFQTLDVSWSVLDLREPDRPFYE